MVSFRLLLCLQRILNFSASRRMRNTFFRHKLWVKFVGFWLGFEKTKVLKTKKESTEFMQYSSAWGKLSTVSNIASIAALQPYKEGSRFLWSQMMLSDWWFRQEKKWFTLSEKKDIYYCQIYYCLVIRNQEKNKRKGLAPCRLII